MPECKHLEGKNNLFEFGHSDKQIKHKFNSDHKLKSNVKMCLFIYHGPVESIVLNMKSGMQDFMYE